MSVNGDGDESCIDGVKDGFSVIGADEVEE